MTLRDLVYAYYIAKLRADGEEEYNLLQGDFIDELIVLLMIRNSFTIIPVLVDVFEEMPGRVSYVPTGAVVDQIHTDLVQVLTGLGVRLDSIKEEQRAENPTLSEEELIQKVESENMYQVERIVNSEEHIIRERTQLDLVNQYFVSRGLTIYKEWVANLDEKTCPVCRAMHGTRIGFDESFEYEGIGITLNSLYDTFADAHPNCRCQIKFIVERS